MKALWAFLVTACLFSAAPAWDIQAHLNNSKKSLFVEARFAPGDADVFVASSGAAPFIQDVQGERGGIWHPLSGKSGRWACPGGEDLGAHVRWRVDLDAASKARDSGVHRFGAAYLLRPQTWILRPEAFLPGRPARLRVRVPEGSRFISGFGPGEDLAVRVDDLDEGPEGAMGPLRIQRFASQGGEIAAIAPAEPEAACPLGPDQIATWFHQASSRVVEAYGRLPLPWTAVFLLPVGRSQGILFGSTMGGGGASVVILLGSQVSESALAEDWILSHELLHTALPNLDPSHHWLEEGLPTYLEPLLRLGQGRMSAEAYWASLRENLPKGLPEPGDRGLDQTPTWGRTYWGGALFCFVADHRIRLLTQGRQTLLDALRAMLAAGGIAREGEIREVLALGDEALKEPVLVPLYEAWARKAVSVDLDALWKRLGVEDKDLNDGAPEAWLRKTWGPGILQGIR